MQFDMFSHSTNFSDTVSVGQYINIIATGPLIIVFISHKY